MTSERRCNAKLRKKIAQVRNTLLLLLELVEERLRRSPECRQSPWLPLPHCHPLQPRQRRSLPKLPQSEIPCQDTRNPRPRHLSNSDCKYLRTGESLRLPLNSELCVCVRAYHPHHSKENIRTQTLDVRSIRLPCLLHSSHGPLIIFDIRVFITIIDAYTTVAFLA